MIRGLGINSDEGALSTPGSRPEHELERALQSGFDCYELASEGLNLIRGGEVIQSELDRAKEITSRYPLHYTVHPPCNLRLDDRTGLHRKVFLACLDVTAQLGADVMVYHSAQLSLRHADHETADLPGSSELQESWRYETAQLKELARVAADKGVVIAVENRDPHLWELAALHRHGKRATDLVTYHQGMRLDLIARQVEEIDSSNVGICLDVGHAFLAAPYWPQPDYLAGIRQAAPWIKHVHMHDNFGRLDDWATSMRERLVFGEADNHMPPGWGRIPLAGVVSILKQANYSGWIIVELDSRYLNQMQAAGATARALLA